MERRMNIVEITWRFIWRFSRVFPSFAMQSSRNPAAVRTRLQLNRKAFSESFFCFSHFVISCFMSWTPLTRRLFAQHLNSRETLLQTAESSLRAFLIQCRFSHHSNHVQADQENRLGRIRWNPQSDSLNKFQPFFTRWSYWRFLFRGSKAHQRKKDAKPNHLLEKRMIESEAFIATHNPHSSYEMCSHAVISDKTVFTTFPFFADWTVYSIVDPFRNDSAGKQCSFDYALSQQAKVPNELFHQTTCICW